MEDTYIYIYCILIWTLRDVHLPGHGRSRLDSVPPVPPRLGATTIRSNRSFSGSDWSTRRWRLSSFGAWTETTTEPYTACGRACGVKGNRDQRIQNKGRSYRWWMKRYSPRLGLNNLFTMSCNRRSGHSRMSRRWRGLDQMPGAERESPSGWMSLHTELCLNLSLNSELS